MNARQKAHSDLDHAFAAIGDKGMQPVALQKQNRDAYMAFTCAYEATAVALGRMGGDTWEPEPALKVAHVLLDCMFDARDKTEDA